jgi:hypothetical protein
MLLLPFFAAASALFCSGSSSILSSSNSFAYSLIGRGDAYSVNLKQQQQKKLLLERNIYSSSSSSSSSLWCHRSPPAADEGDHQVKLDVVKLNVNNHLSPTERMERDHREKEASRRKRKKANKYSEFSKFSSKNSNDNSSIEEGGDEEEEEKYLDPWEKQVSRAAISVDGSLYAKPSTPSFSSSSSRSSSANNGRFSSEESVYADGEGEMTHIIYPDESTIDPYDP